MNAVVARSGLSASARAASARVAPADRVVRVVDPGAETETDLAGGEFVGDRPRVAQRPGEAVELGHHQVSPSRQAAIASRRPGRSRVVPVRP